MDKFLDVMEDVKQNITDNEYKIIMDSIMEMKNGKEKDLRFYYTQVTQQEFDEMTKVMAKLCIDIFYEYTDDDNDVVWLDSIKILIGSYLEKHKIGLGSYRLEDNRLEILKDNNTIIIGDFLKKLKHRKEFISKINIYKISKLKFL